MFRNTAKFIFEKFKNATAHLENPQFVERPLFVLTISWKTQVYWTSTNFGFGYYIPLRGKINPEYGKKNLVTFLLINWANSQSYFQFRLKFQFQSKFCSAMQIPLYINWLSKESQLHG